MGTHLRQSVSFRLGRHTSPNSALVCLVAGLIVAACGGASTSGGGQAGVPGTELVNPGTMERFFVDPNKSGKTSRLLLEEMFWARLVDVYDIDDTTPRFRDFAIGQDIQSDGVNYRLETHPITRATELVILRQKGDPEFRTLLDAAADGMQPVIPKNDDGTESGPFSFVPRNACVVLRFNDCLRDTAPAELANEVKVLTGYPPTIPYDSRVVFDRNHGALIGGSFHSTRVLVDLTVSETEAAAMSNALPINSIGLPASIPSNLDPNVSIRIPTRVLGAANQLSILRSLNGGGLAPDENGPMASGSPTRDIVRALRAGNAKDDSNGFVRDGTRPEVLGSWPFVTGTTVLHANTVTPNGFDFILSLQFSTVCEGALDVGDVLEIGPNFLEVTVLTTVPDGSGNVANIQARSVAEAPIGLSDDPAVPTPPNVPILENVPGNFLSTYDAVTPVPVGCWVRFTPQPGSPPATDVSTTAVVSLRFTEAMDPTQVTALDSFMVVRGDETVDPNSTNIVIGIVNPGLNLDEFQYVPVLPFDHVQGTPETYHLEFDRIPRDLAGNDVVAVLPDIEFTIDMLEPTSTNGGFVLRFEEIDEAGVVGAPDIRGQIFHDLVKGTIRPRDVKYASYTADETQLMVSLMGSFGFGVQDPLSSYGSKLQTVYRHCDFGWKADDETKHNLDIIGLSWAPVNIPVNSDYFEGFEMILSNSGRVVDNHQGHIPDSLLAGPNLFADNVLTDVDNLPQVVHPKTLGYQVSAVDSFFAVSGLQMLPYPFNQGSGPMKSYLWRNTGSLSVSDDDAQSVGLPYRSEGSAGFDTWKRIVNTNTPIPTIGLPLLMEFRCYPSSAAIGMNLLDVRIAGSGRFRAYSTGGTDAVGTVVNKNPDQEIAPTGGFNPFSGAGTSTTADGVFYKGQIDTVTRVSRAHTIWFDTGVGFSPGYISPVVEPDNSLQPQGTSLIVDFRGATDFSGNEFMKPFDASLLDYYGNLEDHTPAFLNSTAWTTDVSSQDTARYLQARLSFVGNIESRQIVELSAIGFPFTKN